MGKGFLFRFLLCAFAVFCVQAFSFEYCGDYTFYYQSAAGEDYFSPTKTSTGFGSLLNVQMTKALTDKLEFTAHLVSAQGQGGEKLLNGYSFANFNTLADDNTGSIFNPFLAEFYLTYSFLDGKARVVAGKIEPLAYFDENAFANDETTAFINKIFVNNVFLDTEDKYCPAVVFDFCDSQVRYTFFVQFQEKRRLVFGNNGWEISETGKQGNFFQNLTVGFQVCYKTNSAGKEGNWRFYYYNNAHPHLPVFLTLSEPNSIPRTMNAAGFGISVDQYIGEDWGFFLRTGKSFDEVYSMSKFFTFGMKLPCLFSPKGHWLFAFGKLSGESMLEIKSEQYWEAQWQIDFKSDFMFAVDFQYISNLNGELSRIKVVTARLGFFF